MKKVESPLAETTMLKFIIGKITPSQIQRKKYCGIKEKKKFVYILNKHEKTNCLDPN